MYMLRTVLSEGKGKRNLAQEKKKKKIQILLWEKRTRQIEITMIEVV